MVKLIVSVNTVDEIEKAYALGADEVVISIEGASFNALKKVKLEDIDPTIPISIFFNCFIFPDIKEHYEELFQEVLKKKIESIYFQDPIILTWAKKYHVVDKCIYRPETLLTNEYDAKWWISHHLKAISISPLLTIEETLHILEQVSNTECIIHGHLMMSCSKRYLLSAFQNTYGTEPLKENYDLTIQESQREGHMPIYEDSNGTLVYTDYLLQSIEEVPLMVEKGVSRLFINGEFLEEDCLFDTIILYRNLLNQKLMKNDCGTYFEKYKNLSFTKGYYEEKTIK